MVPSPLLASVEPSLQFDPVLHIACGDTFVARTMTEWPTAHRALTRGVGLPDRACRGLLRISGDRYLDLLDSVCTNRIAGLSAGEGTDTYALHDDGHVVFDFSVYADDGCAWVCVPRTAAASLTSYLTSRAPTLVVEDLTVQLGRFALMGPQAPELLGVFSVSDAATMPIGSHRVTEITLEPVRVMRSDFAGPLGFDLVTPAEWFNMILAAVCAMGVKLELEVYPIGMNATDFTARLGGRVDLPAALAGVVYPHELGQGSRVIAWEKTGFPGRQEAIQARDRALAPHP